MSVFLLKSILSLFIILSAILAIFTMFEVFGRTEKRFNIEKLKKIHRANGIFYLALFFVISYFCLVYILRTKAELSARASFHSVFAITVLVLLAVKISFVRYYRQFYGQVKTIGLVVALVTFGMMGMSGGYYLLITEFGTEPPYKVEKELAKEAVKVALRTDAASIARGKELYDSKCYLCHDPGSNKTIVGPGHKNILKNPVLPVSRRPATPENVARQLRTPFNKMPSFDYLSDDEVADIIAYLNTL